MLLDGDGKRIVVRYYKSPFASSAEEMAFEKKLFDKTLRTNAKSEGARARPARAGTVLRCRRHCSTSRAACIFRRAQRRSSFWTGW